ncbi:hypothetical protein DM01DRAFT_1385528 [Hesseltinella vesiculosa]|uniref:FMP27 GFWDK domain-containing protein n=1 Tax=Hesseltinella vesiculosa TaxID=101127 RepID=A0A1X2G928_9FUNG|nr:hypothetical protein DM01DRAFT_1385528 [Hesseltinella vesiculosa]
MSSGVYKYVLIVLLVILAKYLLEWTIALCFQLRFGRIGFFSIADIQYRQRSRSDPTKDNFLFTIGKIKLRVMRPTSSLSTAWITIHLEAIRVDIPNSDWLHPMTPRPERSTPLGRRISRIGGAIPTLPWWYSLSVVKHIVKLTSALPAQFLMAGLANYVAIQVDGLKLGLEDRQLLSVQSLHLSSVLFAAGRQDHDQQHHDASTFQTSLNASHERHSLKSAQHLFMEKFFEIIVTVGSISVGQQALHFPQGGRVAISCHFSAGCVTLKDVDVSVQLDDIDVHMDKIAKLLASMPSQLSRNKQRLTDDHPQAASDEPSPSSKKKRPSKSLQTLQLIRSLGLNTSRIRIYQDVGQVTLGVATDLMHVIVTMDYADDHKHPLCDAKFSVDQPKVFIMERDQGTESQLISLSHMEAQGSMVAPAFLQPKNYSPQDDAPNDHSILVDIAIHQPAIDFDTHRLQHLLSLSSAPNQRDQSHSADDQTQPTPLPTVLQKQLPRLEAHIKLVSPSVCITLSPATTACLVKWSSITFHFLGEYTLQAHDLASSSPKDAAESHAPGLRKRKHLQWTRFFRNTWRFQRRATPDERADDDAHWIYALSTRLSMESLELTTSVNKYPGLLSIHSLDVLGSTCFSTCSLPNDHLLVALQFIQNPHHEIDIKLHYLSLCAGALGDVDLDGNEKEMVLAWLTLIQCLKGMKKTSATPPKAKQLSLTTLFDHWLNWCRINIALTRAEVSLDGMDKGIRGQRPVPDGYIDNAPDKDIHLEMTACVDRLAVCYHGPHHTHKPDARATPASFNNGNPGPWIQSSMDKFKIVRRFDSDSGTGDSQLILWMPHANASLALDIGGDGICYLTNSVVIKQIGVHATIPHHYALLLCFERWMDLKKKMRSILQTPAPPAAPSAHHPTSARQARFQIKKTQFQLNRLDVHIILPTNVPLFLRMDGLRFGRLPDHSFAVRMRNAGLFGRAVNKPGAWDQLLELDELQYSLGREKQKPPTGLGNDAPVHQFEAAKFHLRIPYGYVAADIIDNSVNLSKYFKSIRPRLIGVQPFTFFGPSMKNEPAILPHICLHCDKVTLHLEDDPFESRLRLIWRTGLAEQRSRLDVLDAFEAKARTEQPDRVHHARERLYEHNSRSWIKNINEAVRQETMMFSHRQSQYYRATPEFFKHEQQLNSCSHSPLVGEDNDDLSDQDEDTFEFVANSLFDMQVVDLPKHYSLLGLTMLSVDMDLQSLYFSLDNARQFMHDIGEDLPQDVNFSTLAPFHMDLNGGELAVQLRDYPIPCLHVPGAWALSGDYIFGDETGNQDATRAVPISVLCDTRLGIDYSLQAVRVASPPKFYSKVNIQVNTPKLTSICWCVPYQPAIQDVTRTFDTLTRPPVDPSEKVGIWDKIRLMIHTRTKISYNGDLAFVLKGTRDPYDMRDQGFGLAILWKSNVVWWMGHDNPQGEFTQITSQDLLFGVPDLIHGGFQSLLASPGENGTDAPAPEQDFPAPPRQFHQDATDIGHPFLKLALRFTGGIRMGLGCHLERLCVGDCGVCHGTTNKDRRCRHLQFVPHYRVKYKSPRAVAALPNNGKGYDAFAGFRSNFIHFSMSIIKLTNEEYSIAFPALQPRDSNQPWMNSLHLTPGFVEHFLLCFRLFGGNMSYPLRTGSFYPRGDPRKPKKFGMHMQSMKYKVMVDPLRIGYFYKNENLVPDEIDCMNGLGDLAGLKGQVKKFCVDVHQQREIKGKQRSWSVNEAELQLASLDLRVVKATYTEDEGKSSGAASTKSTGRSSLDTTLDDYACSLHHADPDFMQGTDRRADEDEVDSTWVDMEDFVELNILSPNTLPSVQVLPFAYSPCMFYLKQNNPNDVEKYQYLRGTHDCIIGAAPDTRDIQINLLEERSKNIDVQIRKHQTRLDNIERKLSARPDDKTLLKESRAIVEKTEILFEKRNLLQKYLRDLSDESHQSTSTVFGQDSTKRWEEIMGHFKVRYIVHNPQIIWNNSVRNIVYHFMDLQAHSRALKYYMSARSVKFIRDITKKYKQERRKSPRHSRSSHPLNLDDEVNDQGLDQETIQEMLEYLVSERDTKLYVNNETDAKPDLLEQSESIDFCNSEHVNDPARQARSIPHGYSMTSSYLIDLLNAQISLQSDHDPNNLVLMHNERMQVMAFAITEDKEQDEEIQLIKNRTIVSLNNTQFFVAKKEQFDTVDLLLDNHYGAKGHEHWLAWIPAEMVIRYVRRSDKFQRVGTHVSPTILIDRYNELRLKAHHGNSPVFAQHHPFEERCDAVYLDFLELALTADSAQYNAIYEVVVDLLLYKEPGKKERLERLHDIMMAADQGSIFDATDNIVELQNCVRHFLGLRDQYQQNLALLDDKNMADFRQVRVALQSACEDLYLGMEAFKLMQQTHRRTANSLDDGSHHGGDAVTWKFTFSAAKISWEMRLDSETPLCEWHLTNTTFSLVNKEDHTHINTIEVDMLHVKNTSVNPAYVDILSPFIDARQTKLPDFSRHKMLRCYLVALAPVGGIPVIQHLEINLHPIRMQLTYDFGRAMATYFFPAERQQRDLQQHQQLLLQDSPAPQLTVTRPSSQPSTHDFQPSSPVSILSIESSHPSFVTATRNSAALSTTDALQKSASANLDIKSDRDSFSSRSGYARSVTIENFRSMAQPEAIPSDAFDAASYEATLSSSPSAKRRMKQPVKQPDDLEVMKQRASSNRTFILVKIPGTKHCLTYKGPKDKNIEDLTDFVFQQPYLEYRNKTWSWFELLSNIKRDFLRAALLHNSRALLKEKLTIRRHPRHEFNFDSYMYPDTSVNSQLVLDTPQRQSVSDDNAIDGSDSDSIQDVESDKPVSASSGTSWTKKFKRKKPDQPAPSISSLDTSFKDQDSANRSPTEEIVAKGQLLLGKHYHGPSLPSTAAVNVLSPQKKSASPPNGISK